MVNTYNLLSKNEDLNNKGCLLLNTGIYFPYDNQEIVTFEIGFSEYYQENLQLSRIDYCKNKKFNHRYPNKGYITLAKTYGKKICPIGYPIIDNIERINKYNYLIFKLGIKEKYILYCIPLNIRLTNNNPYNTIHMTINFQDPNDPKICIEIIDEVTEFIKIERYSNAHYENGAGYIFMQPKSIYCNSVLYDKVIKIKGVHWKDAHAF